MFMLPKQELHKEAQKCRLKTSLLVKQITCETTWRIQTNFGLVEKYLPRSNANSQQTRDEKIPDN